MKLTAEYIIDAMQAEGFLSVHQVILIDWLNSLPSAEELSETIKSEYPPFDLPQGSVYYAISLDLATGILGFRNELGGYTRVVQLAEVPNMETDHFDAILHTFHDLRAPIPSTKGLEFDNLIAAIGALELNSFQQQMSRVGFLSMIRQVIFPESLPGKSPEVFPWMALMPNSIQHRPPTAWDEQQNLINAVNYIREHHVVDVGGAIVNLSHLLAGLEARLDPHAPEFADGSIRFNDNLPVATYLKTLGQSIFQYLDDYQILIDPQFQPDNRLMEERFDAAVAPADGYGMGDAYTMEFNADRALTWNLLNYFVPKESGVQARVSNFTSQIGLGKLDRGVFEGDSPQFRETFQADVRSAALMLGLFNGRDREVQDAFHPGSHTFMVYDTMANFISNRFIEYIGRLWYMEAHPPAFVSWNRLEGRPRKLDVSQPWRAEVRDPLWFLSRQWQLGEFIGEDTGSAIKMRVNMQRSEVDRYALRNGAKKDYSDTLPMEAIAERIYFTPDLALSHEMGLHWARIITERFLNGPNPQPGDLNGVLLDFRSNPSFHFAAPMPGTAPEVWANPDLINLYATLSGGRALNGWAIYVGLLANPAQDLLTGTFPAAVLTELDAAGVTFKKWFEDTYQRPSNAADFAWDASHLEYQFACSSPAAPGPGPDTTVMIADEYSSGSLDWYNFDIEWNQSAYTQLRPAIPNTALVETDIRTLLPADLRFPGMPLPRWWQMEDGGLNFEHMVLNSNDAATLPFLEFIASYSNDWLLLPFRLPTGSICEVKDLVVRDVFGQQTLVQPAGAGDNNDWKRWNMFTLHRRNLPVGQPADNRLFFPPAVIKLLEGKPLEEVRFVRDEMANMVWGIEQIIPNGMGAGEQGYEAGLRLYNYLVEEASPPTPPPLIANDAKLRYKLGTSVPENWIPFLPMRAGGLLSSRTQLQRAAMPRVIADEPTARVRPRTDLLRTNFDGTLWHPYYIHEEEVPRSGAIVRQSWQRTRWYDGRVVTWLGRRKLNGSGEGNSGLRFDLIEEKKD